MDRFPSKQIPFYPLSGAHLEVFSHIPSIIDYCWMWLLDDSPITGSTFRRMFVPAHYGYADKHPDWGSDLDCTILKDFHAIKQALSVHLVEHADSEIAAFIEDRSQVDLPTINFTSFYQGIAEKLSAAASSGDGKLSREGALASFDQLVLAIVITFLHELEHLYLRWKHPLKQTPEHVHGKDGTKRELGKGEGGEAVEDMLVGGLSFVTQQTGLFCYRIIAFRTSHFTHECISRRWLSLKPKNAAHIVDCLVNHTVPPVPFFRQPAATTINPLFMKDNPLTQSLLTSPSVARQFPAHVTASLLAKFGTLPSSDSFSTLLTPPLLQPAFSTEAQDVEILKFIGPAPGTRSSCLVSVQVDHEIFTDPGEDTPILDTVVQCARRPNGGSEVKHHLCS